ncbi:MAG: translocation/assembly module TamB domain-containing protein, partial [Myxococcota bacterium]|nr:translocation/assembly module TamB domain-containing protein [Myxococcota bacterium]
FGDGGLPLKGRISTNLHAEGTLQNPTIIGSLRLDDFGFGNVALGDGAFALTPGEDGRVDLSATENFPELVMQEGSHLQMDGYTPTKLVIRANAEKADLYRILPFMRLADTELSVSGLVEYDQWFVPPPAGQEMWEIRNDSLPGDVVLSLYAGETIYRSQSPMYIVYGPRGTHLEPLTMGTHVDDSLTVCGTVDADLDSDLRVSGRINLSALRPLRGAFSVLEGAAVIGSDPHTGEALGEQRCLPNQDNRVLWVTGSILHPVLSGKVVTKGVQMIPRNFGQEIRIVDGVGPLFRRTGDPDLQRILMPRSPKERIRGDVEDASFGMWGELSMRRYALEAMDMGFVGTDVFFSSPGEYNMTFNPDLRLVAEHMTDPEKRRLHLSGDTRISEGSYYKSFDRFAKALNAVGKEAMDAPQSYAEPLTERVPWLKDLTMELTASTADFAVRSLFPMGSTDLETRFDLRVAGTLDDMEIYNRLEIIPGGTILYKVIRREFEIVQGNLDFTGAPLSPNLDVEAQTEVSYMPDTTAEDQTQSERTVTVSIRISGPPENLQLAMWSRDNPNLTDADLQSLILTGRPRDEAASLQDKVGLSINFGKLVNDIIKSPIVEALNVTVGTESVSTRMIYRLGRAVKLRTRVIQDATETRVSAGFQFELSDALSLEGALQRTDRTTNPSQTYEAKFKYRIPVE